MGILPYTEKLLVAVTQAQTRYLIPQDSDMSLLTVASTPVVMCEQKRANMSI